MTTQEIIDCCPWRLTQPRPLSAYEWTVVENAVHSGIMDAQPLATATQTKAMAVALTMAISKQNACPNWTHSDFGPAPAVAGFAYGCLGSWWGALDYGSQQRALADIAFQGLLCAHSPPWAHCPRAQGDLLWKPSTQSEYGEQRGILAPGSPIPSDPCIYPRMRTAYSPMTGGQMVELMKLLGNGIVPPDLTQLVQMGGAAFAGRSFVIGWQVKPRPDYGGLGGMTTPAELLKFLDGMLEDVVILWAPGQGISIRHMVVTGTVDPAVMVVLLQHMLPGMMDDILKQLPGWLQQQLPGMLQQIPPIPGLDWGTIFDQVMGSVGSQTTKRFADPGTPSSTGVKTADEVGSKQNTSPPFEPGAKPSEAAVKGMDTETLLLLGAVGFGLFLIWHGYRTR